MAKTAGRFVDIFYAGYVMTGWSNQFEALIEFDELDQTCFLDGAKNARPGLVKSSASLSAFMDPATNKTHAVLKTRVGSYVDKHLMILIGANVAPVIGDPVFMMQSKQFNYQTPLEVASAIIANASFSGQVQAAWGLVLANTTIVDTTSFASIDNSYASASAAQIILQVLLACASDTYAVKLQDSINDADWVDVGSAFTLNASAIGSERKTIAAEAEVVANGFFEGGIANWTGVGAGVAIAQSEAQAFEGSYSLLLTTGTGDGTDQYYAESDKVAGFSQGDEIFVEAHVYVPDAWPDGVDVYVMEYTSGDAYISEQQIGTTVVEDGWLRIRGSVALAEATVDKISVVIGEAVDKDFQGGAVTVYIDKVTCRKANINRHSRLLATRTGSGESFRLAAALDRGDLG